MCWTCIWNQIQGIISLPQQSDRILMMPHLRILQPAAPNQSSRGLPDANADSRAPTHRSQCDHDLRSR